MGVFSVVMYHDGTIRKKKSPSRNPTAAGVMLQKKFLPAQKPSVHCVPVPRKSGWTNGCWQQLKHPLTACRVYPPGN